MKVATKDLIGPALRYTVAQILGHRSRCPWMIKEGWALWQSYEAAWGNPIPAYDTDWVQGGLIIDREGILFHGEGDGHAYNAWIVKPYARAGGPTHLIAAMRCFVASKLGDEVDVPEELL